MNKKVAAIILAVLVVIIGIFSLSMKKDKNTDSNANSTITITDSKGENVEVTKNPQRVVVFDYGVADILKNIGVEIVGLPKSGTLPEILSVYKDDKYANVGDLKNPDFEAIEALNPDLIIISGRQADMVDDFKEIATTVNLAVDGQNYMETFKATLDNVGKIFDKEDAVKDKLDEIEAKIAEINKTVTKKGLTATTVMASEGNISVFSNESRYGIVYNELGFENVDKNIESSNHGQQISFEYFLENKPDYLFIVDRGAVTGKGDSAKSLFDNEIINNTEVAKNDRMVYLDSVVWYTMTGGIESTMKMLNEIEQAIK